MLHSDSGRKSGVAGALTLIKRLLYRPALAIQRCKLLCWCLARVFWPDIPVFEVLEQRGLKVWLIDARQMKYVPGRKSDVFVDQGQQRYEEQQLERSVAALKRRATALGFAIAPVASQA